MGTVDMVWDLPTKGLRILVSSLATPYVTNPQLDTIGLSGVSSLWILESPLNLGGTQPVGYMNLQVIQFKPV